MPKGLTHATAVAGNEAELPRVSRTVLGGNSPTWAESEGPRPRTAPECVPRHHLPMRDVPDL